MAEHPVEEIAAGRWLRLVHRGTWEYVERLRSSGVVAVAAVTPAGKVVLVEQFRPAVGTTVIELPAGLSGDAEAFKGEALEAAARRELEEETGYRARDWRFCVAGFSSAGLTNERVDFFLATGLEKVGDGGGDEHEEIAVHEVPLAEVDAWLQGRLAEGAAIDAKLYTGLYFAREWESK
ncbi:MAG: NUDIX hydrolase [Verrucomicrobiota bacterium]